MLVCFERTLRGQAQGWGKVRWAVRGRGSGSGIAPPRDPQQRSSARQGQHQYEKQIVPLEPGLLHLVLVFRVHFARIQNCLFIRLDTNRLQRLMLDYPE